jgi:hypothetical protein
LLFVVPTAQNHQKIPVFPLFSSFFCNYIPTFSFFHLPELPKLVIYTLKASENAYFQAVFGCSPTN